MTMLVVLKANFVVQFIFFFSSSTGKTKVLAIFAVTDLNSVDLKVPYFLLILVLGTVIKLTSLL